MIEVKNLTKNFGGKTAVNSISFSVSKGEILGFLGPNGAGKSTTMRMLTGYIPPTSGTAVIGGHDIIESSLAAREKIGYLPENAPVYPEMTVTGYLNFISEVRGFSGKKKTERIEETIEKCFLKEVRYQNIGTLSKGFKQRVCFAQAILHDPEYLILDEPTDGLDPNQKFEVRNMIRNMSENKSIILSTHILDEVDSVCSRAIIIAKGTIAADDTPENLRKRSKIHGALSLTLPSGSAYENLIFLKSLPGVKSGEIFTMPSDSREHIRLYPENTDPAFVDRIIDALAAKNNHPTSLFIEKGRLDEVFRSITSN